MKNIGSIFKNNFKENKILVLSVIFSILLVFYIAIPTLSEYKNTNALNTVTVWDGSVAESYSGEGTIDSPYVITNGSELALLAVQLETMDFENKYFILGNDIVLNKGIFTYMKEDGIKYTDDGVVNEIIPNTDNDIVNVFNHLDGFKGNFSGDGYFIYGLYIDEPIDGQNALFTNLEGNVSDLSVKNSIIYGGNIVAGIASKTNNSTLKNVSYNGYVISDSEVINDSLNIDVDDVIGSELDFSIENYIKINNLAFIPGEIINVTLSGYYEDLTSALKINGKDIIVGQFEVDLGNSLLTEIPLSYQTGLDSSNFKLTGLKYVISYDYGNAAGIVSIANNTTFTNVINKAFVYGKVYSSGIVNFVNGTTLFNNVYNSGYIESDNLSSGLISSINLNNDNVTINYSYNSGMLVSSNNAIIGNILNNSGEINLVNVFNTQDSYAINLIESSNVNIDNFYVINDKFINEGTINDELFTKTSLENLENKEFVQTNLNYIEYDELDTDNDGVWIWQYDGNSLPILYIDELNRDIASIHVKDDTWTGFNTEIGTYMLSSSFVFSIEEINELNTIKEIYYYISNEKEALSKNNLDNIVDWQKYDGVIGINNEGFYTIYAKIIDYNDNNIYINTDLLIFDMTGSNIKISSSLLDNTWDSFRTSVSNYYIDKEITISINAEDLLSGINKVYYYVSDGVLSQDEVENIDEWIEYTDSIVINTNRTIIYSKVIDNCNNIAYANSDLIILSGYILNGLSAGMNGENVEKLYITEKSSVSLSFSYKDTGEYDESIKHQIISNVLLPKNTKITIVDIVNNKVYSYITDETDYSDSNCDNNCEAKYNFELFNEVGSNVKFKESNYTGIINENFVIILDFANTVISDNIENISISMKLDNANQNEIRNTLSSSMKEFNIIVEDSDAYFTLNSEFEDTINYNSNSNYVIPFTAKMINKLFNDNTIFDTSYDGRKFGLSVKMINENGSVVDKQYLKNISFKIGDKKYAPSSDGIVRIDLDNGIADIENELVIQTYSDNSKLEIGNYKFIVSLYMAYDGLYSNVSLSNIEIPVYVGINNYNNDDGFNIVMNGDDKIITSKVNEFNFEVLLSDKYEFNNIRVSLYKKVSLSPYDQKYDMIDLGTYLVDNVLELYDENVYYVSNGIDTNGNLNIKLDTSKLDKNGYMFVFELYEDDRIVNKISKKFIVK